MDDCTHRHIQSWQDEDGNPVVFWSCRECGRRFEPVAGHETEEDSSND